MNQWNKPKGNGSANDPISPDAVVNATHEEKSFSQIFVVALSLIPNPFSAESHCCETKDRISNTSYKIKDRSRGDAC